MRKLLLFVFVILSIKSTAQKITGIIFSQNGDLLPYSSITIKGTTIGASANNRAKYIIAVKPGTYTLVCQHIGYATQEKKITIQNIDEELVFFLSEQKLDMKEIVVKSGGEDPAYAIIRSAIKKRPLYNTDVNAFTCDLYSKDIIKLRRLPKRILGKKIEDNDRNDMRLDTMGAGIIYLSESISKYAAQKPDKFKLEVNSSRVSGSGGFGFTFPTFISLYQNNVIIFTQKLSPRGFISPIADGALNFYRFKYLGSFWEDGKEINSIRVTAKRNYEPLFSGIINITEGDWRIHSFDLTLTKKSQLEIIDTLQITQFHVPVNNDTWRVKNQLLHFGFKQFGIDAIGNFVSVYSNYNLQPVFAKSYFDRVIIKYDTGVNMKPKTYWDSIRPVPLEREEIKDYQVKDSLYELHKDSAMSKMTIDSLKKRQGSIKPFAIFWNGIDRWHYSNTNPYKWSFSPLLKGLEYNPAEGLVINANGSFNKYLKPSKLDLTLEPNLRYGVNNKHLNGWLEVNVRRRARATDEELKRQSWRFAGGKRVTQFNRDSPITPLINSISTLLYGDNFMKTYENAFATIGYSKQYESGLKLGVNALFEDRKPLENTTNFTLSKKDSVNITPNYPIERIAAQFTPHKAFIVSLDISFKPGQQYIQFPRNKVAVGSKYPTFSFNYTKGISNIFGSSANFDKWKIGIADDYNFKIGGLLKYKLGIGGFLNDKTVFIQDFQHFNGNRTIVAADYLNSFQMANYYTNSTTASFYSYAHLEHHFNGLLTNKIPLFKRLNWYLVAGTNTFYVNKNSNHVEVFAGIENIFKIFRIDFVSAYINGKQPYSAIRIGFGGLIGGNMSTNSKAGSVTLSF
jgi:hypothetical protein